MFLLQTDLDSTLKLEIVYAQVLEGKVLKPKLLNN
jgi:hypothetical protein